MPKQKASVADSEKEIGFREARREMTQAMSASTLGTVFGMSTETVREKIGHITPTANYKGSPLYRIRDAAPFLVTPVGLDIEAIIKSLKPAQLPNALQKDFWSAQHTRLKFMEDAGQLWRTQRVQEVIGDILKIVRQRISLLTDTLDRQTALTTQQREIVQTMMDTLLLDAYQEVILHFKDYDPAGDRDELLEETHRTAYMKIGDTGNEDDDL